MKKAPQCDSISAEQAAQLQTANQRLKAHEGQLSKANETLRQQQEELKTLSAEERVTELGLNFDRADVIVHALPIYQKAMLWSGCKHI